MIDLAQWRISIGCFYTSRGYHSNIICNIDAYVENAVKKLKIMETSNTLDEETLHWHITNQQSSWQQFVVLETFGKNKTVPDDGVKKDFMIQYSSSGMFHNAHD